MGSLLSSLRPQHSINAVMCGLDASGKTTLLYRMKWPILTRVPASGFNCEEVRTSGLDLTTFDMGGSDPLRGLYRKLLLEADARAKGGLNSIWFMVSLADSKSRMEQAAGWLSWLLSETILAQKPDLAILILVNKTDLHDKGSNHELLRNEINAALNLDVLKKKKKFRWRVQPICVLKKEGVLEGMEWVCRETTAMVADCA